MPFSGMIRLKLKFFKSMQNKITKSIFYFSFILQLKKKDYITQKQFNSEKKEKEERKRRKKKEKIKRKLIKIAIGT